MNFEEIVILQNLAYIAAAILFIFGIKMLGKAATAKRGNMVSAAGMALAVAVTLIHPDFGNKFLWIALSFGIGAVVGAVAAKRVAMTAMPEMVALFNGFGGLASLLVGWSGYLQVLPTLELINEKLPLAGELPDFQAVSVFFATSTFLAVFIGAVTFSGSVYAWGKLSGKLSGAAKTFPGQKATNGALLAGTIVFGVLFVAMPESDWGLVFLLLASIGALKLGVFGVMPIGGGDMPVVISLLNSFSGLAAAAAGFVIQNNVLIVAGCLVGCSGLILTAIMCKAMNRTLRNVLFSGFGATAQKAGAVDGEMKAASLEDAYYVLEAARSVVIVPGYGMAVAQAQHAVKELAEMLEENGAEVRFAIHPVAGRMPGHMNVLLAEADVPYEQLCEMDDVNPTIEQVDVAIVIGANDVVNPAAAEDESSPIYGMPIISVHKARTVYALKRGKGAGFSGLVNALFFRDNCRMLYGDAKTTVSGLVGQFKDS